MFGKSLSKSDMQRRAAYGPAWERYFRKKQGQYNVKSPQQLPESERQVLLAPILGTENFPEFHKIHQEEVEKVRNPRSRSAPAPRKISSQKSKDKSKKQKGHKRQRRRRGKGTTILAGRLSRRGRKILG